MKRRTIVLSVVALGAVSLSAGALYVSLQEPIRNNQTAAPELAQNLVRSHSPVLGPKDAPVTIVEFFDPACEACRAFHPIVKDILAEHGDAVRVVIRYTPFHGEGSEVAIRVLEAARMQGVFEAVLEAILRDQPKWAAHGRMRPELLLSIAQSAGLDPEGAQAQMLAPQTTGVLNQDRADVEAVGVRQTPTFFVNGKPLDPFGKAELRRLVADEVEAAQS
ncbi:MAG: thioredoxin domain-containing protein [Pseudomonadota bacterium]